MPLRLCTRQDNKACSWVEQLGLLSVRQRRFPILDTLRCFRRILGASGLERLSFAAVQPVFSEFRRSLLECAKAEN